MDHREKAIWHLDQAEPAVSLAGEVGDNANLATAHAVLALLDYIQQDVAEQDENERLHVRIRQLGEDLEGAYAALRAREDADAAEIKERKTKTHQHRWIDITVMRDLPNRRYVCHACDAAKLTDPDGNEINSAS